MLLAISASQALWDPFATKFDVLKTDTDEVSIETDFKLGYETAHKGKSSEYHELRDEYLFSFEFKQYLKFNINLHDIFIHSLILEVTWFDWRPISA